MAYFADAVAELQDYAIDLLKVESVWLQLWHELLDCRTADDIEQLLAHYGYAEVYELCQEY